MIVNKLARDSLFNKYIIKAIARFRELNTFAIISNIIVLFKYNNSKYRVKPILRLTYKKA